MVCLTDLTCEVYNATNLPAQPAFRRENVIRSPENIALFAAENSFYVGSIALTISGGQDLIVLGQYGFAGSQTDRVESQAYTITDSEFQRHFYGGFVQGSNAYYFVADNNPSAIRNIRVMRVCHNSNFGALYELTLTCGVGSVGPTARVSGVTLVNNFAGVSGPTVVVSRNVPLPFGTRNFVCPFSLEMIDSLMQQKFETCISGTPQSGRIELAWGGDDIFCTSFMVSNQLMKCRFMTTIFITLSYTAISEHLSL